MNAKQAARVLRQMGATPIELSGTSNNHRVLCGHLHRVEYVGEVPDDVRAAWLAEAIRDIGHVRRAAAAVKVLMDMNNNRREA